MPDRTEPPRRPLRLVVRPGMDDHPLAGGKGKRRLRGEAAAVDGDADRAARMSSRELPCAPDVEHGPCAAAVQRPDRLGRAEERPAVQLDDALHVRRPHSGADGLRHELVLVLVRERPVEAPLEADRRRSLVIHPGAAQRAGDMAGMNLDAVRQLEQPLQAVVQLACALGRLDGQIRPGRFADEQRVARQGQPRLVRPRSVADRERAVLWSVAGRVDDADRDRPHRDLGAVLQRLEVVLRLRGRVDRHRDTVLERESAVAGHVVRVRVRLEHTLEPHPFPLGRFEILLDREGRIDHDCLAGGVVADQVGGTAKIVVDELAKKHETEPNKRSLRTSGPPQPL